MITTFITIRQTSSKYVLAENIFLRYSAPYRCKRMRFGTFAQTVLMSASTNFCEVLTLH